MQSKAKNVDAYLNEVPKERQDALNTLRNLCLEVLTGYEESMEYGMPSYKKTDEVEVAFASQKSYISLYILKQPVMDAHRDKFKGLNVGKGCIRYTKPEKIDFELVEKLLIDSLKLDSDIC